ncbi:hypothetical protein YC2023_015055 [Brassica napus]
MRFWKFEEGIILAVSYSEEMKILHCFMSQLLFSPPCVQGLARDEKIPTNSLTLWICQLVTTASSCYVFRLTTDHNYAYTSTHYPVTTTATSVQLVTGNCSYPLQLLTSSCSLNSTEHISRSRKDKDSDHIFDDQNKLTYAIPFKDNVYGFGDDGLRSITANCRGFCQFR